MMRISKQLGMVGLVGVYGIASVFAILKAPVPYITIWGLGAVISGVAAWQFIKVRLVAINVAVILVCLAGFELYQGYGQSTQPLTWFEGTYTHGQYYTVDPILGPAPKKNIVCTAIKKNSDETVYDVRYTIDGDGLRVTPKVPSDAPICLFFGDSFTFGEGLNDMESLPAQVSVQSKLKVGAINFGFHGYGPQQALASLESGRVNEVVGGRAVKWAVYSTLPDHIFRTVGRYDFNLGTPRYVIRNGILERDGMYPPNTIIKKILGKSRVYRVITRADVYTPATDDDIDRYIKVVLAIRAKVRSTYGIDLTVLLWGENAMASDPNYPRIVAAFKQNKVTVISVERDIFGSHYGTENYTIRGDGHPNALANHVIAAYINTHLVNQ